MANLQYIGARYVPKFYENPDDDSNNWKSGVSYEPLTVVTYLDDSYTSKIAVPGSIGNPADNLNYWIKTGNYNAGMTNLQNQINNINESISNIETLLPNLTGNRKFILIGDSFSEGVQGGGLPNVTGWAEYAKSKLGNNCYIASSATGASFAGNQTYLAQLQAIESDNPNMDKNLITDIVAMGGSNEPSESTVATIASAIVTFVNYCKANYPNAHVRIGCIGQNYRGFVYDSNIYAGYLQGCKDSGAIMSFDLMRLTCQNQYDSGYGHWNEAGYNYYNPYIYDYLINGNVHYKWNATFTLTPTDEIAVPYNYTFQILMQVTDSYITMLLRKNDGSRQGYYLDNAKAYSGSGTPSVIAFRFNNRFYVPIDSGVVIDTGFTYQYENGVYKPSGITNAQLFLDNINGNYIQLVGGFPWYGTSLTTSNIRYQFNGNRPTLYPDYR